MVGAQTTRHVPYGLSDHCNGDEFQSVNQAASYGAAEFWRDDVKSNEQRDGGQREPTPGGEPTAPTRAKQTNRKSDLAARRTGEKLAKTNEIGERFIIQPASPLDEFATKVSDVGDGAAKGCQAKF